MNPNCPDCDTAIGAWHHDGCDVARCQDPDHTCHQLFLTSCEGTPEARDWWDGEWPGVAECRRLGYTTELKINDQRTDVVEDLTRLMIKNPNAMRTRTTPRPLEQP